MPTNVPAQRAWETGVPSDARPQDVTIAELAIESFFPADEATAALFR